MWHEALEQAYRRYFYYEPHGIEAMLGVLLPLYRMLEAGAVTANEQGFVAAYGAELQAALAHCREFSRTGQEAMLQLSWERFYAVLKQLARELQDSKTLQLSSVSPQLLQAHGLELAVPGTYRADREVVAIASFAPSIKVSRAEQLLSSELQPSAPGCNPSSPGCNLSSPGCNPARTPSHLAHNI